MFNGRTQDYDDTTITNSGFWCDITIDEFQKQRAIPLQIPVEMVKAALIAAMQGINIDLAEVEENYRKAKSILCKKFQRNVLTAKITQKAFTRRQYSPEQKRSCYQNLIRFRGEKFTKIANMWPSKKASWQRQPTLFVH